MQPLLQLRGVQDLLQVFEDRIAITPKGVFGFLNKGFKGTKEIPFRSITAVQFRRAGFFLNGYLQFTIPGGNESTGGVLSALKDENSFMFSMGSNAQATQIKAFIQEKISGISAPVKQDAASLADQIAELGELHRKGILSGEEFASAKARLLR